MSMQKLLSAFLLLAAFAPAAHAQGTHGLHARMILPVAVDSSTYHSRIYLTSPMLPGGPSTGFDVTYVPGDGTAQTQVLSCNSVTAAPGETLVFATLRDLCPNLAQGSNFGYLRFNRNGTIGTNSASSAIYRGMHLYSRVSNDAGIGFSIEGFPESAFTGTRQLVIGLDRLPAPYYTPAYQTNCFIGTFADFPVGAQINLNLRHNDLDGYMPGLASYQPGPNRFIRILDVLSSPFNPMPELMDAGIEFSYTPPGSDQQQEGSYPFMAFCTVQDNSSFGADFRIAKPFGYPKDDHALRRTQQTSDIYGRAFALAPNNHATYYLDFRTPDIVGCDLINPADNSLLPANSGIEMHIRETDGTPAGMAITGGNGTGLTRLYDIALGPKGTHGGGNPGYLLVVQSTAAPAASTIDYGVVCRSGSGHSLLRLVESGSGRLIP
jgi:hypothetical protein